MDAADFYFLLAVAEHGRPQDDGGRRAAMFLRRGLIEADGGGYRLTRRGQQSVMDRWTDAIMDALEVKRAGLPRVAKCQAR